MEIEALESIFQDNEFELPIRSQWNNNFKPNYIDIEEVSRNYQCKIKDILNKIKNEAEESPKNSDVRFFLQKHPFGLSDFGRTRVVY